MAEYDSERTRTDRHDAQPTATGFDVEGALLAEQSRVCQAQELLSGGAASDVGGDVPADPTPGINKSGFIDHGDGSNIRSGPAESGGRTLTAAPLPPATRVFVSGTHPDTAEWVYVSADAPGGVVVGYVQHFRVNTDLPEPSAKLYAIESGDTAEGLAVREFKDAVRPGHDLRFYENVLLDVNRRAGRDGIHGEFQDPGLLGGGSNNIQLTAGKRIWLVSPAYARTLEGFIPDGSLTNGAYGQVKQALAHVQDIIASVTRAPEVAAEVAGEYWEVIQEYLPEIIAIVALFIGAEAAASLLAASPTGVGQLAAAAIQIILAAVAGHAAVEAGSAALDHGKAWLTLAWTAKGDDGQIIDASKEFVRMLVMIAMAALAVMGVRGHAGKAGTALGKVDITLPRLGFQQMVTPNGQVVIGGLEYFPGQITATGASVLGKGLGAGPQAGLMMAMSGKEGGSGGSDRGSARSQYTNAEAKAVAEAHGYRAVGKNRSGETIYANKGADPPYIVRSRTGHRGEMFKGFSTLKQAQAGRTSKSARLGSYDEHLNWIAE